MLGVPLALTDYDGTLDWIDATAAAGRRGYVCVAATHTVMASREDAELRRAVLGADFTVPDGQPLVWALNLLVGVFKITTPDEAQIWKSINVCVAERHHPFDNDANRRGR